MGELLCGRVQSGKGDAAHWLRLFDAAYSRKLQMPVYPGSLNLALDHHFDWFAARYKASTIRFGREEYGGERDILLMPCELVEFRAPQSIFVDSDHGRSQPTRPVGRRIGLRRPASGEVWLGRRGRYCVRASARHWGIELILKMQGDAGHIWRTLTDSFTRCAFDSSGRREISFFPAKQLL